MKPEPDYSERMVVQGRMGSSALWVELDWEGQDADAPFTLPDGRQIDEVIEAGEFASIADHVWLSVSNSGKAGDMLWTTSMAFTAVSGRLLNALRAAGAKTVEAFPLTIRRKRSPNLEGYHLVVVTGQDPNRPVREFPAGRRSTPSLDVHVDVLAELRRQGIDGFVAEDAEQRAAGVAAAADDGTDLVNRDARLWDELPQDTPAGTTVLRLRIEDEDLPGQFEVPSGRILALPEGTKYRETADQFWSVVAPDGAVVFTLSPPVAVDASGTPISSWWFEDSGRTHLNVDHLPGVHTYPVTVEATLR